MDPQDVAGRSPGFVVRVGSDVQDIAEVAEALRTNGERYLDRVFTAHEIDCCGGRSAPVEVMAPGLAARFAAKEATIKVLRPVGDAPGFTEIEVRRQAGGWTDLELTGTATTVADEAGLTDLSLSFSHASGIAVATVVGIVRLG